MLTPKERLLNDACKILACRGMQGNEPLQLLYPLCKRRPTAECFELLRNIGYLLLNWYASLCSQTDRLGTGAFSGNGGDREMLAGRSLAARLAVSSICALFVLVFLGVGIAQANFEYKGAFGFDGTSGTEFVKAGSVAVDEEEGLLYVLDRGANALYKFDLDGNPVNFGGSPPIFPAINCRASQLTTQTLANGKWR